MKTTKLFSKLTAWAVTFALVCALIPAFPLTAGTATIKVTDANGYTAEITINYSAVSGATIPVMGVLLNKSATSMTVGGTETLTAMVLPPDATNKAVSWSSNNTAVATVAADGTITGVSVGTATITVTTTEGGFTAACTVTVSAVNVPVTGVTLNQPTLQLPITDTAPLFAEVLPTNATNQNVTWESSNNAVATVSSGVVTAVGVGTATITVTTEDGGFKDTCTVTVSALITIITITFDFNYSGSSPLTATTGDGKLASLPPVSPRPGYTFKGWFTTATGGTQVDTTTVFTANTTVYAQWEIEKYTVAFDLNDGSSSTLTTKTTGDGGKLDSFPTAPTQTGFTFKGWSETSTGTTAVTIDKAYTGNTTLYAIWEKESYTITWHTNDGTTAHTTSTVEYGDTITPPSPNPTRDNYIFNTWCTDTAGNNPVTFSSTTPKATTDTSFYAKWTPVTNTATPTITTQPSGGTYVINATPALTVTATITDGGTPSYQWYKKGTGTDTPVGTNSNTYTPPTTAVGTNTYYCVVTNTNTNVNGTKTATSTSNPATVKVGATITFDANYTGGTVTPASALTDENGKLASLPTAPTRTGYTFEGWYTQEDGTAGAWVDTTTVFTANATIYAQWTAILKYTVTISSSGTGATGGGSYAAGVTVNINAGTSPNGWQFKEWTTTSTGVTFASSTSANTNFTMPANAVTVTAVFEELPAVTSVTVTPTTATVQKGNTQQFNVSVAAQGGASEAVTWSVNSTSGSTISATGLLTVAAGETATTLTVTATSNFDGTKSDTATVTVTQPISTFVAVTEITGVPTNATAGTGLTLSGTVSPTTATNKTIVWSVQSAGATGATISGNTLNATAAGTVTVTATITDGAAIGTPYTQNFNITVSAGAVTTTYTVTFNANGGTVSPTTATTGTDGKLPSLPTPARSGYTFIGWYTAVTGGTAVTTSTVFSADTTVYAQWTEDVNPNPNPNPRPRPTPTPTPPEPKPESEPLIKKADINGDGKVTPSDALIVLKVTVRKEKPTAAEIELYDMNGDGRITPRDALIILKLAVAQGSVPVTQGGVPAAVPPEVSGERVKKEKRG